MVHRTLRCFGRGESDIERMIPPEIMQRGRDPLVGITASDATISLRVATFGEDEAVCLARIQPTLDMLRQALGELVFGVEEETLADAVIARLRRERQTLVVLDLGLCGLVGQWLAEADRAGDIYLCGWQSPSLPVLERFLTRGRDSASDLKELAIAAGGALGADLSVVIGPLPPPSSSDSSQEFSVVLARDGDTIEHHLRSVGHPAIRQARAAKQVLNLLRLARTPSPPGPASAETA
jgi:nicotinamide-nucleotide amidase